MPKNAFLVKKDGQLLDYRVKESLDLSQVRRWLEDKGWQVIEIKQPHRNLVGTLEKDGRRYRLKLAGSLGMGVLVENEIEFLNQAADKLPADVVVLPELVESDSLRLGDKDYPYFIVRELLGKSLVDYPATTDTTELSSHIDQLIDVAEVISQLPLKLKARDYEGEGDHRDFFVSKAKKWLEGVDDAIRSQYQLDELFKVVEAGAGSLVRAFRHGDFTPWHILLLNDGRLGLVDFEHATSEGVEYYDVAYLIQRVWQVLKDEALAQKIYQRLVDRGYDRDKLRTVLAARAIGGFLDEFLAGKDYPRAKAFKEWATSN